MSGNLRTCGVCRSEIPASATVIWGFFRSSDLISICPPCAGHGVGPAPRKEASYFFEEPFRLPLTMNCRREENAMRFTVSCARENPRPQRGSSKVYGTEIRQIIIDDPEP